jgi:hypothetical protein
MNQPTYETTTRSIPTRSQVKIRYIHPGSAVKYGTLCSLVYALLTGVPLALVTIGVARLIISLLTPIINLFHGSVAGATSSASSTTLLLLLLYVIAITLFGCIFTLLATLVYNLLARLTGGLRLDVEDIRQAAQMAMPQEVRQAEGMAVPEEVRQAGGNVPAKGVPGAKETAPLEEVDKVDDKPALNTEGTA